MIKKVITTGCDLWITPVTAITPNNDYMYFEFLYNDDTDIWATKKVSSVPDVYKQPLQDDGLFIYYRLKVRTKSGLDNNQTFNGDYSSIVWCYYDNNTSSWILMNGLEKIDDSEKLEVILSGATEDNLEIYTEPIFSICRLQHCLETKLRTYIFDTLKTCGHDLECTNKGHEDYLRTFLFTTIFILRQLICQQRYSEALRILKSINNCDGICNDTMSSSNDCGCCK